MMATISRAMMATISRASDSDWTELSHECLANILSRLSLEDRWKGVMFVCKSWLQACKDPFLFAIFDLEPQFESAEESPLWRSPEFERKIDLSSVGAVMVLRCPKLQVLSIRSCPNVTDASIAKIASGCSMLTELDISYCSQISHESLQLIGRNCLNLRILKRNFMNWLAPSQYHGIVPSDDLIACHRDGNSEAAAIGEFMPLLEQLELQFSKLSASGLASISKGCLNLERLDLFGCANLNRQDVANVSENLKNLKSFVRPNFHIARHRYGCWRFVGVYPS